MRALAALRMVWASAAWMAGDVGNVVREEAAGGRAALAVSCVVGGAVACEPAVDLFALRQINPFVLVKSHRGVRGEPRSGGNPTLIAHRGTQKSVKVKLIVQ